MGIYSTWSKTKAETHNFALHKSLNLYISKIWDWILQDVNMEY